MHPQIMNRSRWKAGLPGFLDPAPLCSKCLRIRYLFDSRSHYAEIPDDRPVVLPLSGQSTVIIGVYYIDHEVADHLVEEL